MIWDGKQNSITWTSKSWRAIRSSALSVQ